MEELVHCLHSNSKEQYQKSYCHRKELEECWSSSRNMRGLIKGGTEDNLAVLPIIPSSSRSNFFFPAGCER